MALNDIVVADATPADQTFRFSTSAAGKAVYTDGSRSIMEPRSLTIAHSKSGKGSSVRIRTLVRFDDTETDADNVSQYSGSVYLVIDRPGVVMTAADLTHCITMLKNLLTPGNITTLLAGQQL